MTSHWLLVVICVIMQIHNRTSVDNFRSYWNTLPAILLLLVMSLFFFARIASVDDGRAVSGSASTWVKRIVYQDIFR